ncbi:MAG TPA: YkvA family protein [Bacteroidota bacterium]|nr:YkvA family protein [Bacteroidota bacterium]
MKKNEPKRPLGEEMSIGDEAEFKEKAAYVSENLPGKLAKINRRIGLVSDVLALFRFMSDPAVHWGKKALAVGALLYFIIPFDSIPDVAPFVGYLDDVGVIALVVGYLGKQLRRYYLEETK